MFVEPSLRRASFWYSSIFLRDSTVTVVFPLFGTRLSSFLPVSQSHAAGRRKVGKQCRTTSIIYRSFTRTCLQFPNTYAYRGPSSPAIVWARHLDGTSIVIHQCIYIYVYKCTYRCIYQFHQLCVSVHLEQTNGG